MEKVGAVIVTFNPGNELYDLLNSLNGIVDLIVVVDNNSNVKPVFSMSNIKCIKNKKNVGLATALNQGGSFLHSQGYKFAFLFDQDSYISKDSLKRLITTMSENTYAVVGPRIILNISGLEHEGKYILYDGKRISRGTIDGNETKRVLVNITSGSLIDLDVWNAIGKFWDDLFIEMIDNEYDLRVTHYGYSVMIDGSAFLKQKLGNAKDTKMGGKIIPTNHSPKRYWYMYRNYIMTLKRLGYLEFRTYNNYIILSYLKKLLTIMLLEEGKIRKVVSAASGVCSGVMMRVERIH